MRSLEADLDAARALDVGRLADAIESLGFECTRCGACCRGLGGDDHVATVFPDEVRGIAAGVYDWRDVARPVPFGLEPAVDPPGNADPARPGPADPAPGGETFEWALQTGDCGDCTFYADGGADDPGTCTVYPDRPLICRTYPFSVALPGAAGPMGAVVDREGPVRAHECEGLGRDIDRADAEALARTLKERAVREAEEAIAVRDAYAPAHPGPGEVVVHDSEGAKRPDGSPYED